MEILVGWDNVGFWLGFVCCDDVYYGFLGNWDRCWEEELVVLFKDNMVLLGCYDDIIDVFSLCC